MVDLQAVLGAQLVPAPVAVRVVAREHIARWHYAQRSRGGGTHGSCQHGRGADVVVMRGVGMPMPWSVRGTCVLGNWHSVAGTAAVARSLAQGRSGLGAGRARTRRHAHVSGCLRDTCTRARRLGSEGAGTKSQATYFALAIVTSIQYAASFFPLFGCVIVNCILRFSDVVSWGCGAVWRARRRRDEVKLCDV